MTSLCTDSDQTLSDGGSRDDDLLGESAGGGDGVAAGSGEAIAIGSAKLPDEADRAQIDQAVDRLLDGSQFPGGMSIAVFHLAVVFGERNIVGGGLDAQPESRRGNSGLAV